MNSSSFQAYVVQQREGKFCGSIMERQIKDLPDGDLLIKVHYSSLNYKDALSATGNKGVTRSYPHTPGIDAVGIVVESSSDLFKPQDKVIVTSYDLGMNTDGGFAEYIRVPSSWALKLPKGLTMKEAATLGTAGLTAGLSVLRITESLNPNDGKIAVSGATGGVGSLSVAILSSLGFPVIGISGKTSEHAFLKNLGAQEIIQRCEIENGESRPLLKADFAGAIDTVGGVILENLIKSTKPNGVVTCCGNVAGANLSLTVFPFILRGVSLLGIDSQNCKMPIRELVWNKLATEWKPASLSDNCQEISLSEINEKIELMLSGSLKGRTIVCLG